VDAAFGGTGNQTQKNRTMNENQSEGNKGNMNGAQNKLNFRVFEIILSVLISVCGATTAWTVKTVITHSEQLAGINASRFTANNGLEVWQEISRIKESIARIPTEFPPKWFAERVNNLEERMEKLQVQLNENNAILIRLNSMMELKGKTP
jgi:hypothetical protein